MKCTCNIDSLIIFFGFLNLKTPVSSVGDAANKEITWYKKRRLNNKKSHWQRAQQNLDGWCNVKGCVLRLYYVIGKRVSDKIIGRGVATMQN